MTNLFQLAADLARAEGAATLKAAATKYVALQEIAEAGDKPPLTFIEAHRLFELRDDGVLVRKTNAATTARIGDVVGSITQGALQTKVNNRSVLVHRIVWLMTRGVWPTKDIDHINGIRTDNRPENLRECESHENSQNRVARRNSKTGLMGVHIHKPGIYRAELTVRGERKDLGCFDTAEAAHAAYLAAKAEHHKFNPVPRKKHPVCNCQAYRWPHRAGGGNCCAPKDLDSTQPPRYCSDCQYQKTERDPYGLGSVFADERYRTQTYCSIESGCPWGENHPC